MFRNILKNMVFRFFYIIIGALILTSCSKSSNDDNFNIFFDFSNNEFTEVNSILELTSSNIYLLQIPYLKGDNITLYKVPSSDYTKNINDVKKLSKELFAKIEVDNKLYGNLDYIFDYDFQLNICLKNERKNIRVLDEEIDPEIKPIYNLLSTLKDKVLKSNNAVERYDSFFSRIYFSEIENLDIDRKKEFLNELWINLYIGKWKKDTIENHEMGFKEVRKLITLSPLNPNPSKYQFYISENEFLIFNNENSILSTYFFDDNFREKWQSVLKIIKIVNTKNEQKQ